MGTYRVTWSIDIFDADFPRDAAEQAWAAMRRPGSTANAFTVTDAAGGSVDVDLEEEG